MKKVGRKIFYIAILFLFVMGIFYFTPFLFISSETATQTTSQQILKNNSLKLKAQSLLAEEYESFLSKNITGQLNSLFPDIDTQLIIKTELIPLEKPLNFVENFKVKKMSVLLFIEPKTTISSELLTFQTRKIENFITKKLSNIILSNKNNLTVNTHVFQKNQSINITLNQIIAIVLICLLFISISFYFIPKLIKKKKFKKVYDELSLQINLVCENSKLREENLNLLENVQKISNRTPEITLRVIRRYLMTPPNIMDQSLFSPAQQAAVILVCLDEKTLKRIFKQMAPQEISLLQKIMSTLGQIRSEDKHYVLTHFLKDLNEPMRKATQANDIKSILPNEQALEILKINHEDTNKKNIWKKLEQVPVEKIADYLKKQSAQSIAIILYNLSDEKAGAILNALPENLGGATLLRLTALKSLSQEQLKTLETGLEIHFFNLSRKIFYRGWQKATAILSIMQQAEKKRLILALSKRSPQAARRLEKQIICFDDFAFWSEDNLAYLIKKTPKPILLTALMGANSLTKEAFSKNIPPQKWGEMFKVLNTPQTGKIKDINEAQCFIIKKAKALLDKQQLKRKK